MTDKAQSVNHPLLKLQRKTNHTANSPPNAKCGPQTTPPNEPKTAQGQGGMPINAQTPQALPQIHTDHPLARQVPSTKWPVESCGEGGAGGRAGNVSSSSPCRGAGPCRGFGQRTTRARYRRGSGSSTAQRVHGAVLPRRPRRLAPLLLLLLTSPVDSGARRVAGILVAVAGIARAPHFASSRK